MLTTTPIWPLGPAQLLDRPARGPADPAPLARPASSCGVVAVGASAGGIPALFQLLGALPASFPLPILVAQHLSRTLPSQLPAVLGCRTRLSVAWAEDGEFARPGHVHVAPPDRHLTVGPEGRLRLCSSPPVRWWPPAVDKLFASAAESFGPRAAAVVLSGALYDGAGGIAAVRAAGGITMAQDEASAGHFDMPAAAIGLGRADIVFSPRKIAEALQVLAEGST